MRPSRLSLSEFSTEGTGSGHEAIGRKPMVDTGLMADIGTNTSTPDVTKLSGPGERNVDREELGAYPVFVCML